MSSLVVITDAARSPARPSHSGIVGTGVGRGSAASVSAQAVASASGSTPTRRFVDPHRARIVPARYRGPRQPGPGRRRGGGGRAPMPSSHRTAGPRSHSRCAGKTRWPAIAGAHVLPHRGGTPVSTRPSPKNSTSRRRAGTQRCSTSPRQAGSARTNSAAAQRPRRAASRAVVSSTWPWGAGNTLRSASGP